MEKRRIFDEEFKQEISEGYGKIKDKFTDALLTEEGKLDTEKIGNTARDAAQKVEAEVKDSYRRFSEEYIRDGSLDKEKVGAALQDTYQKTGRFLAVSMTRLAEKLTDKFGVDDENREIIDSELVQEQTEENG